MCSKLKNPRRNVTVLAETCQKLAKFPSLLGSGWRPPSTLIFGPCPSSRSSQEIDSREIYHSYLKQIYMDEDNKTIVARSFAYIGHILTKRKSLVQSGEQTFELSKNQEFCIILIVFYN
jgi:hypothetical protein